MTQEEVIALVQECTTNLGHAPTVAEFEDFGELSAREVRKLFGSHKRMLAASGVQREGGCGYSVSVRSLFLDWAKVVRSLGKIPTMLDYQRLGSYSPKPFSGRFRYWHDVPAGMVECARQEQLEVEWNDVMDIIVRHQKAAAMRAKTSVRAPRRTSAPPSPAALVTTLRQRSMESHATYGQPLPHSLLSYAPTNEAGVVLLFGSIARELGFTVLRAQAEFPDCEAIREVGPNRWHRVRIEFEYESSSFLAHSHPVSGCDLIVCWTHTWADCPLEVLELQSVVGACRSSHQGEAVDLSG
jgi:hypothetical protein